MLEDDRPSAEVWDAPAGIRVWNRYFEVMPMAYVTAVVTEGGVLSPEELEEMRGELELPGGIRGWARTRDVGS